MGQPRVQSANKKIYFIVLFFAFFQFFNYDGKGKAYLSNKKTLCNKKFPMLPAGTDSWTIHGLYHTLKLKDQWLSTKGESRLALHYHVNSSIHYWKKKVKKIVLDGQLLSAWNTCAYSAHNEISLRDVFLQLLLRNPPSASQTLGKITQFTRNIVHGRGYLLTSTDCVVDFLGKSYNDSIHRSRS